MEFINRLLYRVSKLFENTYTLKIISKFFDLLSQLWPYVLTGILASTLLLFILPHERFSKAFNSQKKRIVFAASLLGAISPVGTYAVIPVIGSLFKTGTRKGPLTAFMVSSPLINPMLFILTSGAFGLRMAAARAASSIILGSTAGLIVLSWEKGQTGAAPNTGFKKIEPTMKNFLLHLKKQSLFITKVFSVSLLVASAASVLVPPDIVARVMGGSNIYSILTAAALGVPLYACGGGSIPIMQVMSQLGMSAGPILAFFISGPATKASTLVSLFACIEKKIIAVYLAVSLSGAVLFGLLFGVLY
ncbi:MAG: permease [Fibrobacterota bacterium]